MSGFIPLVFSGTFWVNRERFASHHFMATQYGIFAGSNRWSYLGHRLGLVGGDWNMTLIFPNIGMNHSNWLIFFRGVQITNQRGISPKSWPEEKLFFGSSTIGSRLKTTTTAGRFQKLSDEWNSSNKAMVVLKSRKLACGKPTSMWTICMFFTGKTHYKLPCVQ